MNNNTNDILANPQCRTEGFLKSILDGSNVSDPECRLEVYLKAIRDALQGGGSSGGGLLVTVTWNEDYDEADLDKTWQEIHDAVVAGKYVSFNEPYSGEGESYTNVYQIAGINADESNSKPYGVWIANHSDVYQFLSETTSGTLHYEPIVFPAVDPADPQHE